VGLGCERRSYAECRDGAPAAVSTASLPSFFPVKTPAEQRTEWFRGSQAAVMTEDGPAWPSAIDAADEERLSRPMNLHQVPARGQASRAARGQAPSSSTPANRFVDRVSENPPGDAAAVEARESAGDEEPELRLRAVRQGRPARGSNGERRRRGSREES
jgi:hypothetical protein